jgi:hypothetical protein
LIPVELAPEVHVSLRPMTDGGTPPPRCHAGAVRRPVDNTLSGGTRPWDLPDLHRRAAEGETQTSYRYRWTEAGRSILAEEVKNEIYDGATPYSTYVRGVIVDGDRGVLLTGRDDSALIIEG